MDPVFVMKPIPQRSRKASMNLSLPSHRHDFHFPPQVAICTENMASEKVNLHLYASFLDDVSTGKSLFN